MEPNIWGPSAWTFLHSITLNYPDNPTIQQKKIYSDFFYILTKILPCSICKENLKIHMEKYPINFNLDSREKIVKWLIKIHNETNIQNGKKKISYKEFLEIYKNLYKNSEESITYYKNKNKIQKIVLIIAIFLIIFLLSLIIFKNYSNIFNYISFKFN